MISHRARSLRFRWSVGTPKYCRGDTTETHITPIRTGTAANVAGRLGRGVKCCYHGLGRKAR